MSDLATLVSELERAWVEPHDADPAELVTILVHRQKILTAIQTADTSSLSPESKRELVARIRAVKERDERLVLALENKRTETEKQLDDVLHARMAARCYRAAETDPSRPTGRIA